MFNLRKMKIGVMGSSSADPHHEGLGRRANALGTAISKRGVVLLTGATTGLVYTVGKMAHDGGSFHIGISPASNDREHRETYGLPTDACDVLIYTGFGLKGRNVVLVRSCDVVLFIAGAMGSLNEFTIAHDEGKVIGCLTNTGGVADQVEYLLNTFAKQKAGQVFHDEDPDRLLDSCIAALGVQPPLEQA
jgi:uncharacterized protein (TIGR00725 family)